MKHNQMFNIKKIIATAILLVAIVVAVQYLQQPSKANKQSQMLLAYGLDGMSVEKMVSTLDQTIDEPSSLAAGISATEFVIVDGNEQYTFDVPKEKFYLSFAPYINETHPCANHNLITCRGELKGVEVGVEIVNGNGDVVINEPITTMENGFIGVWLPSNQDLTIHISYNGMSAEHEFKTYQDSDTCMTSPLQLS